MYLLYNNKNLVLTIYAMSSMKKIKKQAEGFYTFYFSDCNR